MFRFVVVFAVLAVAMAFQMKINKIVGAVASVGVCLAPLAPALADGAVSASTKYRARTSYGAKIVDLAPAAEKGDFAAFDNKKAVAAFDLFISGSNKKVSISSLAFFHVIVQVNYYHYVFYCILLRGCDFWFLIIF